MTDRQMSQIWPPTAGPCRQAIDASADHSFLEMVAPKRLGKYEEYLKGQKIF